MSIPDKPVSRQGLVYPALLVAAAFLVSLPGFFMGIHADDWFQLKHRSGATVLATFAGDWNEGLQGVGGFYRPMVRVSFAFDNWLHSGSAFGCHFTNFLLFVGLVLGVYLCGRELSGGRPLAPFFATLFLVVLNPTRSEALYWLSGRTDLISAMFLFAATASALVALRRNRLLPAGVSLSLLVLALMTKESGVAGCAIIPLAALMLRGRETGKSVTGFLVLGPVLLGLVYLVIRRVLLGGLGGYETAAPRDVFDFIRHGAMALSGVFAPWQAAAEGVFRPRFAVPGLMLLVLLIVRAGIPRGAVFAVAGMLLSLGPISFIAPTPLDGARVLVLPLGFLAVAVAGLFPPWREGWMKGRVLAWAGVALTLTLVPVNFRIVGEFLRARAANDQVIDQAAAYLNGAAAVSPATLIIPEPPRTHRRRILDPGQGLLMAMERVWLQRFGATTSETTDLEVPRFGLLFRDHRSEVHAVHALQPWMDGDVLRLHFAEPARLELQALRPAGPLTAMEDAVGAPASAALPIPVGLAENQVLVVSLALDGMAASHAALFGEAGDGAVLVGESHYYPVRGRSFAWVEADERLRSIFALPLRHPSPLRLRSASWRVYEFQVEKDWIEE